MRFALTRAALRAADGTLLPAIDGVPLGLHGGSVFEPPRPFSVEQARAQPIAPLVGNRSS